MNDHEFGRYQFNRTTLVPKIKSAFRRKVRTMVLGPDGASSLALVTEALSATGAEILVADMAGVKTDQDIWRVFANLNGTGHPGYCGTEAWDALWAFDTKAEERPLGLVVANLDAVGGRADERYLV
jgi:hypothetical protein